MGRDWLDTDSIKLTNALRKALAECCTVDADGCLIFNPEEKQRHIMVEIYGRQDLALVSVSRVAYALAHSETHVTPREMIYSTCGKHGDHSGRGCCLLPEHLLKGPREEMRSLMRQDQRMKKQKEAA